ncbi:MAG: hypothetical protein ABFS14_04880 [Gemmatimonadota bacterium]
MRERDSGLIIPGAVAGILAGTVVILWFLMLDFAAGDPFHTPARLAGAVLGEQFAGAWPRLVVLYTILHFGVFASLGVVAAWFLSAVDVNPGLVPGVIFGAVVFNAVHYGGLLFAGTNFLTVVPVGHVIAANLLGGLLMMAFLHRAQGSDSEFGWRIFRKNTLLFESLATGLVGAAVVASWFFLIDIVTRVPFHTPAALGSAIILGAKTPAETQFGPGVIGAYTFLHIAAFWAAGFFFVWLARQAERAEGFWVRSVAVLVLLEILFFGSAAVMSDWLVANLGWLTILVANGLAVLSMGLWIWRRRLELGGRP